MKHAIGGLMAKSDLFKTTSHKEKITYLYRLFSVELTQLLNKR